MSKTSQLLHRVSSNRAPSQSSAKAGAQRPSALQPKAFGPLSQRGAAASARTPVAPPAYRPQPAAQAAQAKMSVAAQASRTSPARVAGGIIQANIIGGTQALHARLTLLSRPVHQANARAHATAQPKAGPTFKGSPGRPDNARTIQRKSAPGVDAFQVPLQPKSGGQPIPDQVRAKMEAAFGTDFSDVRVHVGQEASSIGAIAYTWGTNIHFAPGQYNPHTIQGQKLLGHELWHVVQQKSGRVSNPFGSGVAVVQDHALEAEADRMGVKAAMTALVQSSGDQR
jgi:Domain of unknown function (DUF4157)